MHCHHTTLVSLVPLTVLLTSLLGSGHCIAMCGGLITPVATTKTSVLFYHSGRLLGYLILGSLAAALGDLLLYSWFSELQSSMVVIMGLFFIMFGLLNLVQKNLHIQAPFLQTLYSRFFSKALHVKDTVLKAFLIGFLSFLLPCGWLYTYVIAAAGTGNAAIGGLTLFCFWLGTLPALSLAPFLLQIIKKDRYRYIMPIIWIISGSMILALR